MVDKIWIRGEPIWAWGPFRLYGITMFLGILISFLSVMYFWRKQKYSIEILQILLIIIIPTSLFGARIWFLTANSAWGELNGFLDFFNFSGLAVHGGVTISTICALIYLWTKRSVVDLATAFGIILPCVLIGQVIGRWGNFTNHEVYGGVVNNPSSLNWLTFIKPHMLISDNTYPSGAYRQPFFLYESMLNLFAYIVIVWLVLRKNWVKPGTTGSMYLIWYGIVRLIMEPLRDKSDIMHVGGVQTSVVVSIVWITLGVLTLIYFELFTMSPNWVKRIIPNFLLRKTFYEKIRPIKTRRVFAFEKKQSTRKKFIFFGEDITKERLFFKKSDKKKQFVFWGKEVPNKIPIWIIKQNSVKPSKRQLNKEATRKN